MDWDTGFDRELDALNDAHSRARIGTPEYRLRRRMLLRTLPRRRGGATHTLRRPASAAPVVRALPMRRAVVVRPRTAWRWWLAGAIVALVAGVLVCRAL
ncbi:hypothetical protein SAMN02800694_2190 [Luteibacter sp. UNCMF331Sha3.1]|uniref:hypothetical protein n=1 Tax=Luteibacter sp. UNCMF331Sha3.1 TaxID=1502760 RepID=UPI0008CA5ABA|nr:hypothetical protein [Luteibacter sp. UNCMF331Sha3.1]SEM93367.1 hypothetical protein SAMN02800694_2190 [Luteibacter sp. UNCMF331Sha3.1]